MRWETIRAEDYCESVRDGTHDTPKPVDDGYKLVTGKHIQNGQIDSTDAYYISEKDYNKINERSKVEKWDVLMSMIGNGLGRSAVVKSEPDYAIKNIALFKVGNEQKAKWLHYYLSSPQGQGFIYNSLQGSGQPFISLSFIRDFPIPFPPQSYINKSVDILDKYDDLIENNQKQIKLLEEAAQRLYKEWFVDMHFPGWENTKIVDGVPEGWRKEKLEDVITYEIGGGWGEEEKTTDSENEAYVIRGTDFYGLTHGELLSIPFRYHKASNLSSRKLQHGDIIFEVSGGSKTEGVARTALITQSMLDNWNNSVMCASFCKLVRTDIMYSQFMFNHFIYLRQSGKTSEYDKKSASSIVNYRWKDFLSQELVLLPSNSILDKYNALAEAVYSKIVACSLQIEKAKQARDRLLPKLMSGELEV